MFGSRPYLSRHGSRRVLVSESLIFVFHVPNLDMYLITNWFNYGTSLVLLEIVSVSFVFWYCLKLLYTLGDCCGIKMIFSQVLVCFVLVITA